ncbi:MAG: hypothetical protein RLZ82_450 [Actinomycetota bacterium]
MDSLPWLVLAAAGLILLFFPIPKKIRTRDNPKRHKKYRTSGAFLGAVTEIFQPTAANASVVVEEQKVARKATPAPEDKPNKKASE